MGIFSDMVWCFSSHFLLLSYGQNAGGFGPPNGMNPGAPGAGYPNNPYGPGAPGGMNPAGGYNPTAAGPAGAPMGNGGFPGAPGGGYPQGPNPYNPQNGGNNFGPPGNHPYGHGPAGNPYGPGPNAGAYDPAAAEAEGKFIFLCVSDIVPTWKSRFQDPPRKIILFKFKQISFILSDYSE